MVDAITLDQWNEAYDLWINSRRSENTKRSYQESFKDLLGYLNKPINSLTRSDLVRWMNSLIGRELSGKTICVKINAISSFFNYIKDLYVVLDEHGLEIPAINSNPTIGLKRPADRPVREIYYPNGDEIKKLLSVIDRTTINGNRDYAMLVSYIILGRRNTEVRQLKWGDFDFRKDPVTYLWSGKGKRNQKAECPKVVWDLILGYLKFANKLDKIKREDYIFTAMNNKYGNNPITMQEVGRMVKKYAKNADLDYERIHPHSLRHSATMLRVESGQNLLDISSYLGHSSASTTQAYLHQLQGNKDNNAEKVASLLGL
jgi:integrase/recombinase XerD